MTSIAVDRYLNNIKTKLLSNQSICKYLYYDLDNPLAEADISDTSILITDKDNQKIFFTPFTLDSTDSQKTTLTIMVDNFDLDNRTNYYKKMDITFLVMCHKKLWELNDGSNEIKLRVNGIWHELNGIFNNKSNIVGLGRAIFDYSKIVQFNDYFWGYRYCLSVKDFPDLQSLGSV